VVLVIKDGLEEAEFGLFGALDPDALFGPAEDAPEEEVALEEFPEEAVLLEPDESSDPEVDATLPDEEESLEPEVDESPPLPPPILEFAMDEFTEVSD
jgi:hypothetical protein